jgi:hypothetical protein
MRISRFNYNFINQNGVRNLQAFPLPCEDRIKIEKP